MKAKHRVHTTSERAIFSEAARTLNEVGEVIGKSVHPYPFLFDHCYLFRTVTNYLVGRVTGAVGKFLLLDGACWVADTGRFMNALKDGTLKEVEPAMVPCYLNVDSIVDAFEWKHPLPTEQS